MEELESQIAKIHLGSNKNSSSYVYLTAEKAPVGQAELYVVVEIPLFNPAAEESCERISLAIASTLKRAYRKPSGESAFENSLSLINEELGKLASLGQTHWIDKLNCIVAVKEGENFNIATCGKISAFLLRGGEYTDISCSPAKSHPLKTLENYASGKVRLGDLLILSTTQLFNYLSMDRLLNIVTNADFLTATKTVIQLLKENADPQITFGVLLNLQVPVGQTQQQEEDLENYVVEQSGAQKSFFSGALNYLKTAFALDKKTARTPQTNLPKISFGDKLKNIGGNTKSLMSRGTNWWQSAKASVKTVKSNVRADNFKQLSAPKKFLLISALVLLIAAVANITIAIQLKKSAKIQNQISGELKQAQNLLSDAQSSLLYNDSASAATYLKQAQGAIPAAGAVNSGNKTLYNQVLSQLADMENKMEKIIQPQVANLGNLGHANSLIKLPGYLAVQVGQTVISYNLQNSKIDDGALSLPVTAIAAAYMTSAAAAIYDGSSLYSWNSSTGKTGPGYSQSVPAKNSFGGMAQYPVNNRIYIVDKTAADIVNFLPANNSFSKPIVSVRDPGLAQAVDMAIGIDGSVYVLETGGINKFQTGRLVSFSMPYTTTPFSGHGKLYTQQNFKYLYLLDSGNNRITIMDKSGNLIANLTSPQFTALKDFEVDEKNNLMYVLNDGDLLKVTLP